MGDRSKELRQLMKMSKQSSSAAAGQAHGSIDQLSGKDKAKLLKLLREKNKPSNDINDHAASNPVPLPKAIDKPIRRVNVSEISSNSNATHSKPSDGQNHQESYSIVESNSINTLPGGFFDEDVGASDGNIDSNIKIEPSHTQQQPNQEILNYNDDLEVVLYPTKRNEMTISVEDIIASVRLKPDKINTSKIKNTAQSSTNDITSSTKSGALPDGFFDETTNSSSANNDIESNPMLDSFFQEISSLPKEEEEGDVDDVETPSGSGMPDIEYEGLQYAYETRLANLLRKTSKRDASTTEAINDEEFNVALKQANELIYQTIDDSAIKSVEKTVFSPKPISTENQMFKNETKKRSREEVIDNDVDLEESSDSNDDEEEEELSYEDYLENIDWTAKTL